MYATSFWDTPSMVHQSFCIRQIGSTRNFRKHLILPERQKGPLILLFATMKITFRHFLMIPTIGSPKLLSLTDEQLNVRPVLSLLQFPFKKINIQKGEKSL